MASLFSDLPPRTVPETRMQFIERFNNFVRKAFDAVERNRKLKSRIKADDWHFLESLVGRGCAMPFLLRSDGPACTYFVGRLIREFKALRKAKPRWCYYHVTIIHDGWTTSDEKPEILLKTMQQQCRPVLNAMANNFVAVAELQAFSNLPHSAGGQTLTLHTHAIVFGIDIEQRVAATVKDYSDRFQCTIDSCKPIVADPIQPTFLDMVRVLRYPFKGHDRCKNRYIRKDGSIDLNESEAPDRFIRYFRMLSLSSMLTLDGMVYSGGKRAGRIRRDALSASARWAKRRAEGAQPVFGVHEVPALWQDLWRRLGESRFKRPHMC